MNTINERVFGLLEKTNTNWSVSKQPLVTAETNIATNSFGIVRNDNNSCIGVVGRVYEPYQNHELAQTLMEASDGLSINLTRGGVLGSAKVYYQAQLGDQVIGNSNVKRYVTAVNSHDGSSGIGFGSSNTVIVCQNTFYKAYGELQKFRHTTSARDRVKIAMENLRHVILQDEKLMDNFKRMADTPINDTIFQSILSKITNIDVKNTHLKDVSTRTANKFKAIADDINTDVNIHGSNLWGLFNGITRFTNHHAVSDRKDSMNYVVNGEGYKTNLITYNEIMRWIDEHSAKQYAVI